MEIGTRNENNTKILIVVVVYLIAIDNVRFIIWPVNAFESSLRTVSYSLKPRFSSFSWCSEIFPVRIIALVVRKRSLALNATFVSEHSNYELHVSRVVSGFVINIIFYRESKSEPHFIQVHFVLRVKECFLGDL